MPGRDFPQAGVLPELFDGKKLPEEAQGCHVMAENGIPTITTPWDPLINRGILPDQLGNPLPKRDRAWECIGEGIVLRIVLLLAPAGLGGILLFETVFILL